MTLEEIILIVVFAVTGILMLILANALRYKQSPPGFYHIELPILYDGCMNEDKQAMDALYDEVTEEIINDHNLGHKFIITTNRSLESIEITRLF